jgi:hypothetical protein
MVGAGVMSCPGWREAERWLKRNGRQLRVQPEYLSLRNVIY